MSIWGWLKRKSVRTQTLPRHLIFVAGKSPLPMYQVLAMKLEDQPRWLQVDIMVNSVTEPYVEMALSLFKEGAPDGMNIVRHEYDHPGISAEEIHSMLDAITIDDDVRRAIYPGLGPRPIAIPLIWRAASRTTTLRVVQTPSNPVIEESFESSLHKHPTELPPLEDYLQLYGYSIIVDENDRRQYLLNDQDKRIGPFLEIHYDGFLNFKYDSRLSENFKDAKEKSRAIHSVSRELDNIFGRNAIKIESALQSTSSRTNPETHLTTKELTRYTFHLFFDPKNPILTYLNLYLLAQIFHPRQFQIQCYVDTTRGMTIDEAEKAIIKRLQATGSGGVAILLKRLGIIDIEDLEISLQEPDIRNTNLHVIDKGSGNVEGHTALRQHLPNISISNNIALGRFDPYGLTWTIEPRTPKDDSIEETEPIKLRPSYTLAGWKLSGNRIPGWSKLAGHEEATTREILDDIDLFTSSFSLNKQTTVFPDGTTHTSTLRVLNPQMIEYSHHSLIKKTRRNTTGMDALKGNHISFPMKVGRSNESEPFRMEWLPTGGVWLESLCAMLVWKLFSTTGKAEIVYDPSLTPVESTGGGYTPEGIIQTQGIQIVWEVKSSPVTFQSNWRKHITQASEYGNLAPYRHTMPLLIHCDENPDPTTLEFANQCKVALCAWWEIPNLREIVKDWGDQNNLTIVGTESIPHFDYSPTCISEFESNFAIGEHLPDVTMTNTQFKSASRVWFNSIAPDEQETQEEDIWVQPLLHLLKKSLDERTREIVEEGGWEGWTPTRGADPPPFTGDAASEHRFYCPDCMDTFPKKKHLTTHMKETGDACYKCNECEAILNSDSAVVDHHEKTGHEKIGGNSYDLQNLKRPTTKKRRRPPSRRGEGDGDSGDSNREE